METAEGKQLYLARLGELATNVFSARKVIDQIHALNAVVQPVLAQHNPTAARIHAQGVDNLIRNVTMRAESLKRQLVNPNAFATGQHPLFPDMIPRTSSRTLPP